MTQPDDNFIGRWSRRKRSQAQGQNEKAESLQPSDVQVAGEVAAEVVADIDGLPVQEISNIGVTAEAAVEQMPLPASAAPTDADMVALDTLDADSDYAPFLSEGVSRELRKAALKKLFFSGKFAARDGLDDYDDDFTKFEPLGDTITSDMKFHARRKEKARLAQLEEERLAMEVRGESASESEETDSVEVEIVEQDADNPEAPVAAAVEPEIQHSSVPASIDDDQQLPQTDQDSGKTA